MTLRNAFEDLATEATLASLNTKTPALSGGRVPVADSSTRGAGAVDAGTVRTTQASDSPLVVSQGAPADAAATSDTGTFSLIALVKRALQNWTTLLGRVPALTVTSTRLLVDGSGVTQPVSAASLPLPTGAATAANQTTSNTALGNLDADLGAPADAAATSDTGSFSVIALVKRGLQNWTTLLARVPILISGATPVHDNNASLTVDGRSGSPVVTFTRPADTTAYGAADVIGSATTANHEALTAGVAGNLLLISSASVVINATTVPSGLTTMRIHLWDAAPAAIADNAVFAAAAGDRARYCGFIDLSTPTVIGGGFLWTQGVYTGQPIRLVGSSFFFNLALTGALGFTPASGTEFRVRFHCPELGA